MRFAALLFLLWGATGAQAGECGQLPPPSVTIKRLDSGIAINTEHSYKALDSQGAHLARPGDQVLGITRGNVVVDFKTTIPAMVNAMAGWECASPKITLSYGFTPITIFIAREFPEGSCAYNAIYEHEMRHVKAYQDHIASIEKELADTLGRRFATGKPWRGPVGLTQAMIQQEVDDRWVPLVKRIINRVEAVQAGIDTPEEYDRLTASCGGDIRRKTR